MGDGSGSDKTRKDGQGGVGKEMSSLLITA